MKCQKNMYPYNENNVCLVISGIDMDYAFSNEEFGKFSLRTSCIVSPNVRCIKEKNIMVEEYYKAHKRYYKYS